MYRKSLPQPGPRQPARRHPGFARHVLAIALFAALSLPACRSVQDGSPAAEPPARSQAASATAATANVALPDVALPAAEEFASADQVAQPIADGGRSRELEARRAPVQAKLLAAPVAPPAPYPATTSGYYTQAANTEHYAAHADNPVHRASEQPVSTFSIDVDTGSYANVRRMLDHGLRPPADAVRAEEMINYFDFHHPAPVSRAVPFRVSTELAPAPWDARKQLLMIGIKGYEVPKATLPPANLVFLIDTSGSMDTPDKLPLLKQSFAQLVPQLRAQDRVSIVVYAGAAGLVLPPTPGDRHDDILAALDRLSSGGSTNGGDGIRLAYAMAKQAFIPGGANRVILATDGDFNVGTVNQDALETLVADQRKSGIALTTLGFGAGNYNDALAEQLADVGDGNHAYIDSLGEARKVFVQELGATLLTIARDVKIQVEFNPAQVAEYRLIGYENRVLRREDFGNDKVDAGDIGAGHEVTALYELVPAGSDATQLPPLRYGTQPAAAATTRTGAKASAKSGEIADLRLRYKRPGETASQLIEAPILRSSQRAQASDNLRFAAAVAAYADALRGGTHLGRWGWDDILAAARDAQGNAASPQRAEFVGLVRKAQAVVEQAPPQVGMLAD